MSQGPKLIKFEIFAEIHVFGEAQNWLVFMQWSETWYHISLLFGNCLSSLTKFAN